ncbi:hypothetical protein SBRCBS47491_009993 [Sporothrix bragantina]|uniref:Uncharacterized protein n=1 Tax=Sporothrix bragantina TaxID=671064 RepID=A0ABP0CZA4_9PEZI
MSSKASFYSAAKRIETEKSVKHVGTASVRLDALDFPSAGLDRKNVERLKRLFQAGGCFPGQFANRIPALIHAEALQQALALSGVSAEQLRSGADVSDGHAPLEVPAGIRLHCLRGRHRAVAAGEMPTIRQKRWTVDLFLPDSSEDLRYALMDEYANEHCPDDGLFYFQIRLHQGVFGPRNRYFENRWWARLSAVSSSTNKKDRLRQLYRHKEFAPAFDAFRSMPALYYGLRLSVVNKMISMGCQELWLYALREYRYMPPVAKKKLAMPDTGVANERVLYDFAALASKLGFATDAIEDLLQQNPDRAIARRLLLAARNPEQHEYPDLEQCITQIMIALSAHQANS